MPAQSTARIQIWPVDRLIKKRTLFAWLLALLLISGAALIVYTHGFPAKWRAIRAWSRWISACIAC